MPQAAPYARSGLRRGGRRGDHEQDRHGAVHRDQATRAADAPGPPELAALSEGAASVDGLCVSLPPWILATFELVTTFELLLLSLPTVQVRLALALTTLGLLAFTAGVGVELAPDDILGLLALGAELALAPDDWSRVKGAPISFGVIPIFF